MLSIFFQPLAQHAFAIGTVIAIVAAVMGYFVVLRAQTFAVEAFSHIGFAGATGAALIGMSSLFGMIALTLLSAFGMGIFTKKIRGRDVEIGMILSFALGLGVLFLRLYTNSASEAVGVLFGSILSVTTRDIFVTLVLSIIIIGVVALFFRPLLFISIDPEVAEARGVRVQLLSLFFLFLLAVTVAEAVQVVGVLLIFALLVAPAAIAQHLTSRPLFAVAFAIIFGLVFTWGGLIFAFVTPYPASFSIAVFAAVTYFIVVNISHITAPHHAIIKKHPSKEVHLSR